VEGRPPAEHDALAAAYAATWEYILSAIPGAWTRRVSGTMAAVSTIPLALMNGVWVIGSGGDRELVAELLGEVAAARLPHCLQLRPNPPGELIELAAALEMSPQADTPLLTLTELAESKRTLAETSVGLRRLDTDEWHLHCEVAAAGFGAPYEFFATIASPAMLALPGVGAYLAEEQGVAVATAIAIRVERHVGIFNVGTPSEHRRRGYAGAVTALAVCEAFADGADTAWLVSSPMGRGVYERLGFRLAESWRCWVAA
jgi:hypothetical protein